MSGVGVASTAEAPGLEIAAELRRGTFRADVSLTVGRGEALALLGPNGAGKSTVLRAVAGLDPVAGGTVRIDGCPVEDTKRGIRIPARQRGIGYVFQDYRLFPHLDVLDNVAFGIRSGGIPRRESRRRASDVLERAGIAGFASAFPGDLSGGETQRVAVARALAVEPGLLLMDEPLAALDVENRTVMREHLVRAIANFDASVLLVTHDPGDALAISREIAIIERGRIVQRGTGTGLSAAPASAYVARLVGRTGIAGEVEPGATVGAGGEVGFQTAAGPLRGRVVARLAGDRFPAGPVFASFNPSAVRLDDPGVVSRVPNHWPNARVVATEHDLGHTSFQLDLNPEGDPVPVRAAVAADRAARLGTGDHVAVEIPPDAIQVTPTPG